MIQTSELLRFAASGVACALLAACGGGGSSGSSPSATSYSVSATAGSGGSISPAATTVTGGGETQFTVTANSGYAIGSVTGCGGTLAGNTYTTAAVNADCTVTANFVLQYTVTATAGAGGSISPSSATVNAGATTTFTITPPSGGSISGVTGCGGTLSGNTYVTGAVNANCSVTASFVLPQYTVTATAGNGGTIAPASATVSGGGTTQFTITPRSGYAINSITGCGGGGNISGDTYTTGAIGGDCALSVTFVVAFTWLNGPNVRDTQGTYGAQGIASPTNLPGARADAVDWRDASGNLWLFGGNGLDSTGDLSILNDLWEYSPASGEWTWVDGSKTARADGVYGTQGVAAAANMPGAREYAVSWTDANGNLWLFGGLGYDSAGTLPGGLNDLWEYSPSSNEWTWKSGGDTYSAMIPSYGTQGVPAPANVPGSRTSAAVWTDGSGNLWMFGGSGEDSAGNGGYLNDLWKYSPSSGEWTWLGGSDVVNAPGVYGSQRVPAATNVPGARQYAVTWADASGNLWLFGGYGYDSAGTLHYLNDLWEYSVSGNEWTWVADASTVDATGAYGIQGVPAARNVPGARQSAVGWIDAGGNLWLFGGYGYDSVGGYGDLNDLWEYSPASGEWTWVSGSDGFNARGIYNTLGVAAAANVPGARDGAVAWVDGNGNLLLFGGIGIDSADNYGNLNDLWEYPTQ